MLFFGTPLHRSRSTIPSMKHTALIAGDTVALAIVTVIGFASHGEFSLAFLGHMAAAFVPLCIGWFLLAAPLGLFEDAGARLASNLWRPAFAMLFAGPFAVLLRGILLASPIQPTFGVVLTLTSALALTLWRLLWWALHRRAA